jgi:hypothetical protein
MEDVQSDCKKRRKETEETEDLKGDGANSFQVCACLHLRAHLCGRVWQNACAMYQTIVADESLVVARIWKVTEFERTQDRWQRCWQRDEFSVMNWKECGRNHINLKSHWLEATIFTNEVRLIYILFN